MQPSVKGTSILLWSDSGSLMVPRNLMVPVSLCISSTSLIDEKGLVVVVLFHLLYDKELPYTKGDHVYGLSDWPWFLEAFNLGLLKFGPSSCKTDLLGGGRESTVAQVTLALCQGAQSTPINLK